MAALAKAVKAPKALPLPFAKKLVLNQWLLGLFGVNSLEDLARTLRDETLEGLDANGEHKFHHALALHLPQTAQLTAQELLEYDQRIVRVTLHLNERRVTRGHEPVVWKYFQYLALLFAEIYLDHYFRDPAALLAALNAHTHQFNIGKPAADSVTPLDPAEEAWPQLNKIAFWMATGSGKTLLMHANILQFQEYLERNGRRRELNRIVLLTPNEGLSAQHLREFAASGIDAELFQKDGRGLFTGRAVEVLEVTKLGETMGVKTVAADAFEGNNLVLVDEGHRGTSSGDDGAWMTARNKLCANGFSFEYSATFGQAVRSNPKLTDLYAKNTLFDYSYRYFYGDGFGKDYQILNLDDDTQNQHLDAYLVAALLSYFQQLRLFSDHGANFRAFLLEKPLWVFVGGSVTASLRSQDASDIVQILRFFAEYVRHRTRSIELIHQVLDVGLIAADGHDLLSHRFNYLQTCGLTPAQIFDATLVQIFHAPAGGTLYVENQKGVSGEVALRIGAENAIFGLINVGDDAGLLKRCDEANLETGERQFSESLFQRIQEADSPINLLIGSRKFTEGWSSWRVSTLGLMNIGRGEGSQIIQLFGRGVRLRGHNLSLKRSARLPAHVEVPKYLEILETLGIFGIRADYMAQFREFLKEEQLPDNARTVEILLPIVRATQRPKLKVVRVKTMRNADGEEIINPFRKLAPVPTLAKPQNQDGTKKLLQHPVVVNLYPKIQAMKSEGVRGADRLTEVNIAHLQAKHVAFLDLDRLYFELERWKAERGWFNLNLSRAAIASLLEEPSWYELHIPQTELECTSWRKVGLWNEIAAILLKKYVDRFYANCRQNWELPHLEYAELAHDAPDFDGVQDPGAQDVYRLHVNPDEEVLIKRLQDLRQIIADRTHEPWSFGALKAHFFANHLYQPLLSASKEVLVTIQPVALNEGEGQFVEDLRIFHETHPEFFADKHLYLLRNSTNRYGTGFIEAGNFYPDFIVWLLVGAMQHVIFVDPKGLLRHGFDDDKIRFAQTVKEIQARLGDAAMTLDSFIVSHTPFRKMEGFWHNSRDEMAQRHVVFQEDADSYIQAILQTPFALAQS